MPKYNSIMNLMNQLKLQAKPDEFEWMNIFEKAFNDTISNTVQIMEDETTFVITGDIDAMWLRDSTAQIRPYLIPAKNDRALQKLIAGLIQKQLTYLNIDVYANAFNKTPSGACYEKDWTLENPWVWERKYEIDSLCYPIQLSYLLWKNTGYTDHFNDLWIQTARLIVDTLNIELQHDQSPYSFERDPKVSTWRQEDTLTRNGRGPVCAYTGLSWSGFRPSDDAQQYSYHIPGNYFATVILDYMNTIVNEFYEEPLFLTKIQSLRQEILQGLEMYSWNYEKNTLAYEVDGLGNMNCMDDANVPSLLSLPYLGALSNEDPKYIQTRSFILSKENPYFYSGKYAQGIGSSHTPENYVWPIALAMEGLTSTSHEVKKEILNTLVRTDANTQCMHEGFDCDNPNHYTREWFSWANMMFCELVLDYYGYKVVI